MKPLFLLLPIVFAGLGVNAQWVQVDSVNTQYYGIHFVNDTEGYIGGNGYYKKTTDGGYSWQVDTLPGAPQYAAQFNFFNNGIVLIGSQYASWESTDGGNTWGYGNTSYPCYFLPNSLDGFSAAYMPFGDSAPTFKTNNAGNTWIMQGWTHPNPNGFFTGVAGISFADNIHGCIVAGEGAVYITNNGGVTRASQLPYDGTALNFTDVYMKDSLTIFIVGSDISTGGYTNVILRTTDGGASWSPVYSSGAEVKKITFANDSDAFAGGYYLVESKDGGNTWVPDTSIYGVVDFTFPNASTGFVLTWDTVYGKGSVNQLRLLTGLREPGLNPVFHIYPNPAVNYAILDFDAAYTGATIFVKDITGRQVLQTQLTTSPQQLPTGSLTPGVYMVMLYKDGQVGARLLVKE
jgi:photosystem II stability/assembly factor-like uncharacterized protein